MRTLRVELILLFGKWPAATATVLVVVTGVFFVALGLLWTWAALMFAVLQNTLVWTFVLVAVGLVVLVAGIV
jgi:hypothetical protein